MSVASALLAMGLMAPLPCVLWHRARLGQGPTGTTFSPLSAGTAGAAGAAIWLALATLVTGALGAPPAVALALAVATLLAVGILYFVLIRIWPCITIPAAIVCTLAGAEFWLLAWMQAL